MHPQSVSHGREGSRAPGRLIIQYQHNKKYSINMADINAHHMRNINLLDIKLGRFTATCRLPHSRMAVFSQR